MQALQLNRRDSNLLCHILLEKLNYTNKQAKCGALSRLQKSYSIRFFKYERKYYAGTPVLCIFQSCMSLHNQTFG